MATVDEILDVMDAATNALVFEVSESLTSAYDFLLADQNRGSFVLPASHRRTLILSITKLHQEAVSGIVQLMSAEFKDGYPGLQIKANQTAEITRLTDAYVNRYGARQIAQIIRTTEQQVRDLVNGGMAAGEARSVVFRKLGESVPSMAEVRGLVISRTEAHAASQYASQLMAERSQIPLAKIWNTVLDDRTRSFGLLGRQSEFNHRTMHETKLPLQGKYLVPRRTGGAEALLFPGDPSGSAGNVINCRCIQTYVRA